MTERNDTLAIPLIGASIPRSGHHHLARLLQDYFGPDLRYCPVYDAKDCCRQAPCTKAEGRRLVFQKSHDFAFRLPADLPGAVYLIQHRSPVPNALSGTELRARRNGMRPPRESLAARFRFYDFLGHRLAYYKRFHDKWIVAPPVRSVVIEHGALEADPVAALGRIATAAGLALDAERMRETTERLRDANGPRKQAGYKPRVVEDSPFFDRAALAAYEAAVIDRCPAFGYRPTLGGGPYRRHPLWWLANIRHGFGRPFPPGGALSDFD